MSSRHSDVHALASHAHVRQATPFDGILEQTRDLTYARLDEAIACMLDKAEETLFALIKDTREPEERRIYEEAKEVAVKQRDTIETQFQERYLEDFKRRSDRARKIGQSVEHTDLSTVELELVADDDLEETLKFNDMANKLRAYCEEELVALDQRVGVLLGDAGLQAKDNPFSPQVICDAYKLACRALDVNASVRRVLLKLFDDHVLDDIRSVYKAVNALLVRNCILPKIRYNISRNQDKKAPAQAGHGDAETPLEAALAELNGASAQDLFSILQRLAGSAPAALLAQGPGGSADGGGSPGELRGTGVLQGAELIGSLTRIQQGDLSGLGGGGSMALPHDPGTTNVLHQLKNTSVGAGMGQLDLLTLDIIALLFDQLFDDPKVPNGVKGLIGRLQIPMLKVAIADKSFFSTKSHPARRLLDTVGEIAARLPADFGAANPLFTQLQQILQALVDGFKDDVAIFAEAREQLHALLAEEDKRIEAQTRCQSKRVEEMENLALAKSIAQEEIKARLKANKLPAPVREFLAQQWLKLLLLIHVKEGKDGRGWQSALHMMDQLIWSIEPKTTTEDRRKLGTVVPKLIKHLSAGMKSAGIDDSVREQFFAELMKCHKQAIGAHEQGLDAAAAVQALTHPAETAPARAQQPAFLATSKPAAAESLDFTAPITVKNPYGEGEVSVDSQDLDFTAIADSAKAKREESIRKALDNLGTGSWVEFADPANPARRRPARLIFISPRQTRYLFAADRAGREIIQCTRAEIGRRLRIGEVVKLDKPPEDSLFDRIMSRLLGKLRGSPRAGLFPLLAQ